VQAAGKVREVAVPPTARALCTLARVSYQDAFTVEIDSAQERTAEQWARAILEQTPISIRSSLLSWWSALGLKLGPPWSNRHLLGWHVRHSTPDYVLLGADSCIGMPAQLLLKRNRRSLLFATFVQQDNAIAQAAWTGIEPVHKRAVPDLLARFIRSTGRAEPAVNNPER
jgi:hypothetical protein